MKKKLFFALLVLILSSCSLFFQKEYGTITIDLEGGRARSINSSTGLPNLADSELEIDILTEGNSSIYKKILASEPKFFQADFPIGSRLEITVKLNGPSSSWSAHNSHTVKEGNNDIRLLLNKNASSLANVGFSTKETNTYEFNIAGKRIDINSRELPVFTRDSRGRLYIAYKQSAWALNRYESDGTQNNFDFGSQIVTTITGASSVKLASDPITGKVYALIKDSSNNVVLYRIKDDGSVIAGSPTIPVSPIAVYNNNLFALDIPASPALKMFTITEGGSGLTLNQAGSTTVSTGQITISGTPIQVDFKDILVKKDKIYILFAKNNLPTPSTPSPYYSLGGMLEYTYNSSEVIDNPQKYGFNDTVTAENDIVTAGETNFYGPACFIGYDEQSISIADDGCTFKKEGGSVRIYKNVNRIFSFNTSTKSLYSYATENKWFKEYEETATPPPPPPGTTGKVLLWQKNTAPTTEGFKFYLVDENNSASLPSTAFLQDNGSDFPTDVFCYDQEGNLYVVWFDTTGYFVRRYEKANGYSTDNTKENQQKMVNDSGSTQLSASQKPTAIAVDVSDTQKGYVYYSYKTGEKIIIRNRWFKSSDFKTGSYLNKHTLNNLSGANDSKITSMTVNNDGLFVAQKNEYTSPKKFKNVIHKYSNFDHSNTDYIGDTSSTIPHNTGDNYVDENIFAMQIINGVLYYTVIKQDGQLENQNTNIVKTSAKLVKSSNPLNNAMNYQSFDTVWSTQSSSTDGYAPYRFIGTVLNKLIIASDGYYGDKNSAGNEAQNKNKVLSFDITASTTWTLIPKNTDAKFSRELTYATNAFKWE
ncbi:MULTISPECIES: hypothetical protein [Treponema]|uniref:hypothetical protein n=1 Tax=Treponema TaxID=157 RepID=UPI0002B59C3E|nr:MULTISPECIES: hypothetical protein [Treponema]EMB42378.1 hypothetical protein HMPREF9729_02402 [Treponema denticola ASLM]EMD56477.1 hypothetical protein HMPREF9728_01594 [Treponema denticola US-Trep]UTD09931.1 hypothetical protein HYB91_05155 [Treponema sp. B152]